MSSCQRHSRVLNVKDKNDITDITVSSKFWSLMESKINMPDTEDYNGIIRQKVDVSVIICITWWLTLRL